MPGHTYFFGVWARTSLSIDIRHASAANTNPIPQPTDGSVKLYASLWCSVPSMTLSFATRAAPFKVTLDWA